MAVPPLVVIFPPLEAELSVILLSAVVVRVGSPDVNAFDSNQYVDPL